MTKQAILALVFAGFFFAPIIIAIAIVLLQRHVARRGAPSPLAAHVLMAEAQQRRDGSSSGGDTPPPRPDLAHIVAYDEARKRFWQWVRSALILAPVFALGFNLWMTAIGMVCLIPLYAAITCLRCPACDTTPALSGMTVAGHCHRCGTRLLG